MEMGVTKEPNIVYMVKQQISNGLNGTECLVLVVWQGLAPEVGCLEIHPSLGEETKEE